MNGKLNLLSENFNLLALILYFLIRKDVCCALRTFVCFAPLDIKVLIELLGNFGGN